MSHTSNLLMHMHLLGPLLDFDVQWLGLITQVYLGNDTGAWTLWPWLYVLLESAHVSHTRDT